MDDALEPQSSGYILKWLDVQRHADNPVAYAESGDANG